MLQRKQYEIDLKTTEAILQKAVDIGAEFLQIEGVLNDSYLIYNHDTETGKRIKVKRQKPRKYIILDHEYLNSQANTLYVTLTDSDKEARAFEEAFERFQIEMDEEEEEYYRRKEKYDLQ